MLTPTTAPLPPRVFHDGVYAGGILHFTALPEMAAVVVFTRGFLEEAFHPHAPTEMHRHLTRTEQAESFRARSRDYARSEETKRLWRALFEAVGLDPETTARDKLFLRFQPHREPDDDGPRLRGTATVRFHRDTWGTNLYAQVNWWAPVYPITEGRTVAFYPTLWSKPVANTSPGFDVGAAIASGRAAGAAARSAADPVPHLAQDVSREPAVPLVIDPGSIVAFSGAHAHAGVGNCTGLTRISLETRTLWIPDHLAGRGAPNVDGEAPLMSPGLFRRLSDGVKLEQVLGTGEVAPYVRPVATS